MYYRDSENQMQNIENYNFAWNTKRLSIDRSPKIQDMMFFPVLIFWAATGQKMGVATRRAPIVLAPRNPAKTNSDLTVIQKVKMNDVTRIIMAHL